MRRREFVVLLGGADCCAVDVRGRRTSCRPSGFWVRARLQAGANGLPLSYMDCAN